MWSQGRTRRRGVVGSGVDFKMTCWADGGWGGGV